MGTAMNLVARTMAAKLVRIMVAKAVNANYNACDRGEDGIGMVEGAPNYKIRRAD